MKKNRLAQAGYNNAKSLLDIIREIGETAVSVWWHFFDWLAQVEWRKLLIIWLLLLILSASLFHFTEQAWGFILLSLALKVLAGGKRKSARRDAQGLHINGVEPGDAAALKPVVANYLKREAALLFPSRLALLAPACARRPTGLQLSSARTRWGSCTAAGVVRLNWRLVQAPLAVLDYVIAHELAHLKHMDHSAAFWAETARLFPDWRNARAWLKQHGATLFKFD